MSCAQKPTTFVSKLLASSSSTKLMRSAQCEQVVDSLRVEACNVESRNLRLVVSMVVRPPRKLSVSFTISSNSEGKGSVHDQYLNLGGLELEVGSTGGGSDERKGVGEELWRNPKKQRQRQTDRHREHTEKNEAQPHSTQFS